MSDETRTSPEVEVDSIPLALPEISEDDIAAVVDVLRGSQLSLGPRLGEFEQAVAGYAGSREAVAVSSGTAALHMLVHALGIGQDGIGFLLDFGEQLVRRPAATHGIRQHVSGL